MPAAQIKDLRDYLKKTEELGLLKKIEGADWNLEIGALSDLYRRRKSTLFDKIKGYPEGHRVFSNIFATEKQQRLVFRTPLEVSMLDTVSFMKEKLASFKPMSTIQVASGPVLENILTGDGVDLFQFPTPKWHELDGGRYIGTADLVITRDPDSGWVNFGTHRCQIQDAKRITVSISPQRHAWIIAEKYWRKGLNCPVAVACGEDPTLFLASFSAVPAGVSEYEYAGWLRNEPVEVILGPVSGIPVPASAEIILEGEMPPPQIESLPEGPFGEWTGYYAGGTRPAPVVRITSILHRKNPILCGVSSGLVPSEVRANPMRSAVLWTQLEEAGIPDIKGVWFMEPGGFSFLIAISIKQRYPGHAMQTAMAASGLRAGAGMNRMVVVIDDDIDVTNEDDVWWAIASRWDPASSTSILSSTPTSPLDPRLEPAKKSRGEYTNSRALLNACRPFDWIQEFPKVVRTSPELREHILKKFGPVLSDLSSQDLQRMFLNKVVR